MSFKVIEVVAASKEEAKAQIESTFIPSKEVTQSYKHWKQNNPGTITANDEKEWMRNFLAKNTKNQKGLGFFITVESAVADTRERPYKIMDVKNEKGKRKYKTVYQLMDKKTQQVLAQVVGTKTDAKKRAQELIVDGFHGAIICKYTKQVVEGGEPIAFEAVYTPSKNSKQGVYKFFGIELD